jgi:hypothetical protein
MHQSDAAKQELNIYKHPDGTHDWKLIINADVVATSGGQGYVSPAEALDMALKVIGGHYSGARIVVNGKLHTGEDPVSDQPGDPDSHEIQL